MTGTVHTFKLASVLLQYPGPALLGGVDQLEAAARGTPRGSREPFLRFIRWLATTPPAEVAPHYVDTFDLRRRCALYLTYFRYGDTRKRGMAMLAFSTAYRTAGFEPPVGELPDYLPMVLEFASMSPRGEQLLRSRRADVEILRKALHQAETPYVDVLEGVCAHLPGLGRRELAVVRNHFESGPPHEEVGLEPFAPPEYMGGEAVRV
ncbi:MAG: nitrate reductase molybdenum cofactor assembly chaperone [Cellulomonas sp.]